MDLGRIIRKHLQEVLDQAQNASPTNIASATNVSSSGRRTSVYSDDHVTIIQRDGETQVIRHDDPGPEDGHGAAEAK